MADDSILNGTKRALGIDPSYTQFDPEIIMFINSAFGTLHQLGVGPIQGFAIEDASAKWASFLSGDNRFNGAKQYVYQKVRVAWDPPSQSSLLSAMQDSIRELEYRLNFVREGVVYGAPVGVITTPDPGTQPPGNNDDIIYDGGSPTTNTGDEIIYDGGTP